MPGFRLYLYRLYLTQFDTVFVSYIITERKTSDLEIRELDNADESLQYEAKKKPLIEMIEEYNKKSENHDQNVVVQDVTQSNITETDNVIIDHDRKLLIEKCGVSKSKFLEINKADKDNKAKKNITIKEVQKAIQKASDINDEKIDNEDKTVETNDVKENESNDINKNENKSNESSYDTYGVERKRCGMYISFLKRFCHECVRVRIYIILLYNKSYLNNVIIKIYFNSRNIFMDIFRNY